MKVITTYTVIISREESKLTLDDSPLRELIKFLVSSSVEDQILSDKIEFEEASITFQREEESS